ncbi:hypothetical protein NDU88_005008 [Pleurodeles waltl]|uniref:Uncharacterized protein n=1 Tax=Pleurodeles waltl TaxID=8319 RepID=A0AAV7LNC9_PLEWA|nr:hypothetical protein NDU88_005008 [Pleurodeles waltl]
MSQRRELSACLVTPTLEEPVSSAALPGATDQLSGEELRREQRPDGRNTEVRRHHRCSREGSISLLAKCQRGSRRSSTQEEHRRRAPHAIGARRRPRHTQDIAKRCARPSPRVFRCAGQG